MDSFFGRENLNRLAKNPFVWIFSAMIILSVCAIFNVAGGLRINAEAFRGTFMGDINFSVGALAGFICYLFIMRPKRCELIWVCALGVLLDAFLVYKRTAYILPAGRFLHFYFLGVGLFLVSVAATFLRCVKSIMRRENELAIQCLECITLGAALPTIYLMGIGHLFAKGPYVYDGLLLAVDGLVGTQPSFVVSAFLRSSACWSNLCTSSISI